MAFDKDKWKQRARKTGLALLWTSMVTGLILSLGFVSSQESALKCTKISVDIEPEEELRFIDREIVLRSLRPDADENKILGTPLANLKIQELEARLEANKAIRDAEVFTDMNGILHIHIEQRHPLLRVINANQESYYIDREGFKIPASPVFTAHVPVATGNIFESQNGSDSLLSYIGKELFTIATYVDKDAFWKAQIEQIFVNAASELVLVPKVGDHLIVFGNSEKMDEKFRKLMLFYQEALSRVGWDQYSEIDLRYEGQIVCKKKMK